MPSQLKFICPQCGISAKVPKTFTVIHCHCGHVTKHNELIKKQNDLLISRIAICESCEQYMGKQRCKLIDLGCHKTFLKFGMGDSNSCPEKKWPNPS